MSWGGISEQDYLRPTTTAVPSPWAFLAPSSDSHLNCHFDSGIKFWFWNQVLILESSFDSGIKFWFWNQVMILESSFDSHFVNMINSSVYSHFFTFALTMTGAFNVKQVIFQLVTFLFILRSHWKLPLCFKCSNSGDKKGLGTGLMVPLFPGHSLRLGWWCNTKLLLVTRRRFAYLMASCRTALFTVCITPVIMASLLPPPVISSGVLVLYLFRAEMQIAR